MSVSGAATRQPFEVGRVTVGARSGRVGVVARGGLDRGTYAL
jgi:hypothetical protein